MSDSNPLATEGVVQTLINDMEQFKATLKDANDVKNIQSYIDRAGKQEITSSEITYIRVNFLRLKNHLQTNAEKAAALQTTPSDAPAAARSAADSREGSSKPLYDYRDRVSRRAEESTQYLQSPRPTRQPQPSGEENPQLKSLPPPPRKTRTKAQESSAPPQQSYMNPASQVYQHDPSQAYYHGTGNAPGSNHPSQPSQYYPQQLPPTASLASNYGPGAQYLQGTTGQGQGYPSTQGSLDPRFGQGNVAANASGFSTSYVAQPLSAAPHHGGAAHYASQGQAMGYDYSRGAAPGQTNIPGHPTQYNQASYGRGGAPPGQGTMFQGPPDATMYSNRGHNRNVSTSTFGHGTRTHTHNSSVANEAYAWSEWRKQGGMEPWDGESDSPPEGY